MPSYENYYLTPGTTAWSIALHYHDANPFSGDPDITLTLVKDEAYSNIPFSSTDFNRVIRIGRNCYIESLNRLAFHNGLIKLTSVKVNERPAGKIVIGDNVVLQGTAIVAYDSVIIENNVTFGPNVTIMDSSGHPLTNRGSKDEAERITTAPVCIREHAWIGMNSLILKGVTIGRHAVVGAGSVVRENVPDYTIVHGNPATIVMQLNKSA